MLLEGETFLQQCLMYTLFHESVIVTLIRETAFTSGFNISLHHINHIYDKLLYEFNNLELDLGFFLPFLHTIHFPIGLKYCAALVPNNALK